MAYFASKEEPCDEEIIEVDFLLVDGPNLISGACPHRKGKVVTPIEVVSPFLFLIFTLSCVQGDSNPFPKPTQAALGALIVASGFDACRS